MCVVAGVDCMTGAGLFTHMCVRVCSKGGALWIVAVGIEYVTNFAEIVQKYIELNSLSWKDKFH